MLNEKDKIGGKKKERKKKDLAYYVTNHLYLEIQWIKELRNGIIVLFWSNVE